MTLLQPGSLATLRPTLDRRFWLVPLGTAGALLLLGIDRRHPEPALHPDDPTEMVNLVVWLASAPLIGLPARVRDFPSAPGCERSRSSRRLRRE